MEHYSDNEFPLEIDTYIGTPSSDGWIPSTYSPVLQSSEILLESDDNDQIDENIVYNLDATEDLSIAIDQLGIFDGTIQDQVFDDNLPTFSSDNAQVIYPDPPICNSYERYPIHTRQYLKDTWSKASQQTRYFIRNQPRENNGKETVSEDDVALAKLKNQFLNDQNGEFYWFHATSWKSAKEIVRTGPQMSEGPTDLAYHGAFYLNSYYDDCYNWLYTKDSSFKGEHAMLIYKFDPEKLSNNGEKLLDKRKWKQAVVERSKSSARYIYDWTYTYQNSDTEHIKKSGDNIKARLKTNGDPAMQLIVYKERMCRKIHDCLIGCVYYEKLDDHSDVQTRNIMINGPGTEIQQLSATSSRNAGNSRDQSRTKNKLKLR